MSNTSSDNPIKKHLTSLLAGIATEVKPTPGYDFTLEAVDKTQLPNQNINVRFFMGLFSSAFNELYKDPKSDNTTKYFDYKLVKIDFNTDILKNTSPLGTEEAINAFDNLLFKHSSVAIKQSFISLISIKDPSKEKIKDMLDWKISSLQNQFEVAKDPSAKNKILIQLKELYTNILTDGKLDPNKLLKERLNYYREQRETSSKSQYLNFLGCLFRLFGAYSKNEKFAAVDALINCIDDVNLRLDKKHLGPLRQGKLGKLVKEKDINLDSFVEINSPQKKH